HIDQRGDAAAEPAQTARPGTQQRRDDVTEERARETTGSEPTLKGVPVRGTAADVELQIELLSRKVRSRRQDYLHCDGQGAALADRGTRVRLTQHARTRPRPRTIRTPPSARRRVLNGHIRRQRLQLRIYSFENSISKSFPGDMNRPVVAQLRKSVVRCGCE